MAAANNTHLASCRRTRQSADKPGDRHENNFSPDILRVLINEDDDDDDDDRKGLDAQVSAPPSFHRFQDLPAELRCLIWEAAPPEPTVVPRTWNNAGFGYTLQRKVPAVLQACAESRSLLIAESESEKRPSWSTVPKYNLVKTGGSTDGGGGGGGVYLNWESDSIWIYRGYDIHASEVAAYSKLRSLVMSWGLRPCWVESAVDRGISFIQQFPRLTLLTLLVDFSEHGWPEPSTLKGLKRLKRNEVKRIWGLVHRAFGRAQEQDPSWVPPSLHIVHRTANWSRREAK